MAAKLRIPISAEPTNALVLVNMMFSIVLYDYWGSGITDEYVLFSVFVIAIAFISCLWILGFITTTLNQVLAVLFFFTLPFNIFCSLLGTQLSTNNLLFIRVVTGFAVLKLLKFIPSAFPRSFSAGELLIVLQLAVSFIAISCACFLDQILGLRYSFCSHEKSNTIIHFLSLGVLLFAVSCKLVRYHFKRETSGLIFTAFIFSISLTYYCILTAIQVEPIEWLIAFATESKKRRLLMLKWSACLVIHVVFAAIWSLRISGKAETWVRKIFHLGVCYVFITGISVAPELLSFCAASLLLIFIVLECWRISDMWPIAGPLNACMESFIDEKDQGILITTHMYLLIGVSLPLWLLPSGNDPSLATFSGVISVGIGDAAASIIGPFGRHRWPKSKKSVEGTAAAMLSQLFASVFIWYYLNPGQVLSVVEVLTLAIISTVVAVVEAKTSEIDNLVLPLYHSTLILVAKMIFHRF